MKNIKGFAVGTDGNRKRIAITYDEIDESGKVTNSNVKVNRIVTDESALAAVDTILEYAQNIIEGE